MLLELVWSAQFWKLVAPGIPADVLLYLFNVTFCCIGIYTGFYEKFKQSVVNLCDTSEEIKPAVVTVHGGILLWFFDCG